MNCVIRSLVVIFASCLGACSSPGGLPRTDALDLPAWTTNLQEAVSPVPPSRVSTGASELLPAAVPPARGLPRDLSSALGGGRDAPAQGGTRGGRGDPGQLAGRPAGDRGRGGDAWSGRLAVDVNVRGLTGRSDAAEGDRSPPIPAAGRSDLERLYQGGYAQTPQRSLEQFGYGVFRDAARLAAAAGEGPVPAAYPLGPGDEVLITVAGAFHEQHTAPVDRSGRLTVPEVGVVPVAGRTLAEARDLVFAAYARTRRGFTLDLALGSLRQIQVRVLGEVVRPGVVDVSAMADVIAGLAAAGGPLKTGSLRRVKLLRPGAETRLLDLYEYLLEPDDGQGPLLRAGDVLSVPPLGETVAVAGLVRRPGIYELTPTPGSLSHALDLAGGLTPFTFRPRVQLERTISGRGRETLDVSLAEAQRQLTRDGDLILVAAVDDRLQPVVRVSGEVVRPGNFQHRPGLRLSEALALADGPTIDAHLDQVFLSRQTSPTALPGGDAGQAQSYGACEPALRVLNLGRALAGDPRHDLELHPLDVITVQRRTRARPDATVTAIGALQRPGRYRLTEGLRVSDLVALTGNLTPRAFPREAELVRQVVDPEQRALRTERFRFDLAAALARAGTAVDPVLQHGDQLVVRQLRADLVRARIEGEVRFPGEYVFPSGARISDLLAAAGGPLGQADLRASVFTRASVRELQLERFRDLLERSRRVHETRLEDLINEGHANEAMAGRLTLSQTQATIERMRRAETTGRVVVPFTLPEFPRSDHDLVLEDDDKLLIKRRQETVSVVGHVFNPSTFVSSRQGLTVEDALANCGGLLADADEDRVYVIRADGVVQSRSQDVDPLEDEDLLLAGDVLLIPRRPIERTTESQLLDAINVSRQLAEVALILSRVPQPGPTAVNLGSDVPVEHKPGSYEAALPQSTR